MLLTPSAEVAGFEGGSLCGGKSVGGVRVVADGVLARKELGGDFGIAFRHKVLVYEASALTSVVGNVLLAHFVSWSADPVDGAFAVVAVDVGVDVLASGQVGNLLFVASQFEHVQLVRLSARGTNFSVNRTGGLTEQTIFSGHKASVSWQVLARPSAGPGRGSRRDSARCLWSGHLSQIVLTYILQIKTVTTTGPN